MESSREKKLCFVLRILIFGKRLVTSGIGFVVLADELEKKRLYRFAEQLRGAALSISNNIAEGSGSTSKAEFKNFLNYARRSVFECASMVAFFARKGYIDLNSRERLFAELNELSKMIIAFSRSV